MRGAQLTVKDCEGQAADATDYGTTRRSRCGGSCPGATGRAAVQRCPVQLSMVHHAPHLHACVDAREGGGSQRALRCRPRAAAKRVVPRDSMSATRI